MSKTEPKYHIAEPHDLSPRSKWLRDYYFLGVEREWNNEFMPFTTGTDWDIIWNEGDFYIVPEIKTKEFGWFSAEYLENHYGKPNNKAK